MFDVATTRLPNLRAPWERRHAAREPHMRHMQRRASRREISRAPKIVVSISKNDGIHNNTNKRNGCDRSSKAAAERSLTKS